MKLRNVKTVFFKEIVDVTRDRKTLIFMMVLPTVVMPLLMIGFSKFMRIQREKTRSRVLTIAVPNEVRGPLERMIDANIALASQRSGELLWKMFPDLAPPAETEAGSGLLRSVRALMQQAARTFSPEEQERRRLLAERMTSSEGITALDRLDREDRRVLRRLETLTRLKMRTEFQDLNELAAAPPDFDTSNLPKWLADDPDAPRIAHALLEKRIHAALLAPPDFNERVLEGSGAVSADLYFDSTVPPSAEAADRVRDAFTLYGEALVDDRLVDIGRDRGFVEPLDLNERNIAPVSRQIQAVLGSFLPYIVILFCLLGGLYPALDIGAGEKERFTLETLLLSPVSRLELALGKFGVIFVASLLAAVLSILTMSATLLLGILPKEIMGSLELTLDARGVMLSLLLAVPIAAVFAAVLLCLSIYARSFKEAQNYAAPLQFLVILPAMVSLIPDFELTPALAWVPIMNVSLLMREFFKGNYALDLLAVTLGSTLLLAVAALLFTAYWFKREAVLFRE